MGEKTMTIEINLTESQLETLSEAYSRADEKAWHLADSVWMSHITLTEAEQEIWAQAYAVCYRMQRLEAHLATGRRQLPVLVPVAKEVAR